MYAHALWKRNQKSKRSPQQQNSVSPAAAARGNSITNAAKNFEPMVALGNEWRDESGQPIGRAIAKEATVGQRINRLQSFVVLAAQEHAEGESVSACACLPRILLRILIQWRLIFLVIHFWWIAICHMVLNTFHAMSILK